MTLFITLTLAEADTGPFNLYSNVDGYISAFATNVSKISLLAGYSAPIVPDGTTTVKVKSLGVCSTTLDISVPTTTTTTTTTTLAMVIPVIGTCCGGVVTKYIPYIPIITIGSVVASNTEGFLGGYVVTGPAAPGVANLFLINSTDYGNCGNFSSFWGPSACV